MAEELRLDEIRRDSGAVDPDEGPIGPLAVLVDRVGHQLLARSALAVNQDVGVGGRREGDQLEELLHLLAAPDNVSEPVAPLELRP